MRRAIVFSILMVAIVVSVWIFGPANGETNPPNDGQAHLGPATCVQRSSQDRDLILPCVP